MVLGAEEGKKPAIKGRERPSVREIETRGMILGRGWSMKGGVTSRFPRGGRDRDIE